MADLSFLYIAFFLTIGSFLLGLIAAWNLKGIFDEWKDRAEYAAVVMHPEMQTEDGYVDPADLLYLRIDNDDDMIDDEDD
jgi:hypothetical protein